MTDPARAGDGGPRLPPGSAVLAFDVGGTDVKSCLVDGTGTVQSLRRTTTPQWGLEGLAPLQRHLVNLRDELARDHPDVDPRVAGLVVPGVVDEAAGIGVFSSNLGWRDVPVRDSVGEALGLPLAFAHDVRAAGLAEGRLGAARGLSDYVVLAVGTGLAGAIVLDGRPYTGGGFAGEFGHALDDADGEPCRCGAQGCLETVASAGAIVRRYAARTGTNPTGAQHVLALADAGDVVARAVWDDAVEALAQSIARIAAILAVEAVVIGGGLSRAGDVLFDRLAERIDGLLSFHRRPRLIPAALGDDAGVLGAALYARDLADRA